MKGADGELANVWKEVFRSSRLQDSNQEVEQDDNNKIIIIIIITAH